MNIGCNKENSSKLWSDLWNKSVQTLKQDEMEYEREVASLRWRKIERIVLQKYSSFQGLKVIEIGSGRGIHALAMARRGADVTCLDISEAALGRASELFTYMGCKGSFVKADVFNIPTGLLGNYDITMSFGLAEHFRNLDRIEVIKSHLSLLVNGGTTFISVPNRWCFPYRIFKKVTEATGLWPFGLEIPFSRRELILIASSVGLQSPMIIGGSSFVGDAVHFLIGVPIKYIAKRLRIDLPNFSTSSKQRNKREYLRFLNDRFGYALVLVGHKPAV